MSAPKLLRRLGSEIRAARERRGMRGSDLAQALEVAPCTLTRIETGKQGASPRLMARIEEELGLLLTLTPDPAAVEQAASDLLRALGQNRA